MRAFNSATFEPAISWAKRHERSISAVSLAGGFAFDSVTFGRIDHAVTQAVFIVYLLVAGIAIAVLHGLDSAPSRGLELGVLFAATLTATITRYVAMRTWVFAHDRHAVRPSLDLASR